MFDADRPIVKSTQDRLDRSVFAKYLARCMLDHKEPESLVVGLYGGWGAGKTSVINLVLEELSFAATNLPENEQPIVLNFSPWSYSGQNQLIYSFFRRLSSTLHSVPNLENSDRIIQLLELYISFFTHQPVPKPFRKKHSLLQKLMRQDRDDVFGWESGRDLTLVKAELNELLSNQKRKIIIVIDNISRIYDYEIKQIFQIVKSMGDYSNTAYLLAMDKEHVVTALNKIDGRGGEEYIEKIIQLPFDIPPIKQQDIERIFADRLSEIMAIVPVEAWNTEQWAEIYYSSLKYIFENCRDITRYVNTLSFSYSRLRDVVNPVDFFALTAIEVFTPEVYFGIRENKDLFTDLLDQVYALDQEQIKKDLQRCNEILARTTRIPKDILLELIVRLFPRIRKIYYPESTFFHSATIAHKLRRLSSPDIFDVYYRLSMQVGQIPNSEFDTILQLADDVANFDQALVRLNKDDRVTKFLDLLDGKTLANIPRRNIQAIVSALINNGDLFPMGVSGLLSLSTPMRIHRIIHGLMQRFQMTEERFLIMQNAVANANRSLFILVHELREQDREHTEESDTYVPREYRDLAPEQLASLRKLTVSRIQTWAENGSLIDHPQLMQILFAWRDWGSNDDVYRYVNEVTKTDRGLVSFLTAILDKAISQAMTNYQKDTTWDKYLEDINLFVATSLLEEHAKIIFEDAYFEKLREREQLAVMIFLDLIKIPTKKVIPKTSV